MRTVDPAKHEAKRRQILAAAATCFAEKGFHRARTADICAAAGISAGNLFHYFPNKQAIIEAIVAQEGRDTAEFFAGRADSTDPLGGLLDLLDLVVDLAADPGYATLALEISAEANRNTEVAALVIGNDRELRDGLADLLRRAAAIGQIDAGLAPDTAATWLAALVDGLFNRVAVDPEFAPAAQRDTFRLIVTRALGIPGSAT